MTEWIETTSKTVDEAKELALDSLGIDNADAEFEIVEEPRQGLFGRTRGQARVRARIAPQSTRVKEERGRRRRKPRSSNAEEKQSEHGSGSSRQGQRESKDSTRRDTDSSRDGGGKARESKRQRQRTKSPRSSSRKRSESPKKEDASMEEVSACVESFLSGLVDAFDIDTNVVIDTSNDEINAQIEGKHGLLLGPKARTLDAIQELTRVTAQRSVPSSIRIKVDVGEYRQLRRASLQGFARDAGTKALEDGVEVVLEPMSSADRKIIHDELNEFDGVHTRSAGTDPRRRVVVVPDAPRSEVESDEESSDPVGDAD